MKRLYSNPVAATKIHFLSTLQTVVKRGYSNPVSAIKVHFFHPSFRLFVPTILFLCFLCFTYRSSQVQGISGKRGRRSIWEKMRLSPMSPFHPCQRIVRGTTGPPSSARLRGNRYRTGSDRKFYSSVLCPTCRRDRLRIWQRHGVKPA